MHFQVITLMPDWVSVIAQYGVVGKAFQSQKVSLETINPRDFTQDTHRTVDDRPFGGGPGMVMKTEPLAKSIIYARQQLKAAAPLIYLSPQGVPFTQSIASSLAKLPAVTLLCGRYEGIDERIIEQHVDLEISLGDFVLSGGELAAMTIIDSITRLQADVLGHQDSATFDSFNNLEHQPTLDCAHYTRPENWQNMETPQTLLSGNHQKIATWRQQNAAERTWQRRPEKVKSRA